MPELDVHDPTTPPRVRDCVYGVLAHCARTNQYEHLSLNGLFLLSADRLLTAGLIAKPRFLGGQTFASMAGKSHVPGVYPDYEIPHSLATLIRQTLWELCVQGVLAPEPRRLDSLDPQVATAEFYDRVALTPYGIQTFLAEEDRIRPHDPEGYLALFSAAVPPPDAEMMSYLEEAVSVFTGGHLRASVLLLHLASERLMDVLASRLAEALQRRNQSPTDFHRAYLRKRDVSLRFQFLENKLLNGEFSREIKDSRLGEPLQTMVTAAFHSLRIARNQIAHERGAPITWNEANGHLHLFARTFRHVNEIIRFLDEVSPTP